MHLPHAHFPKSTPLYSRREAIKRAGAGFGLLALASLFRDEGLLLPSAFGNTLSEVNPLAPHQPHFPAKAKAVIWLFINGGPSQVDTWDYKPELDKRHGVKLDNFDKFTGFFSNEVGPLMKSPFKFQQYGESATWVSELFPNLSKHVDKMAFIHSLHSESNNHSPALFMMNTGMPRMGFPCVGSWATYGLGTENQNLPACCVRSDRRGRGWPKGSAQNWGSGFLPEIYQGTYLRPQGDAIDNLKPPSEMTDAHQRAQLALLETLNREHLKKNSNDEMAARIQSFELAYRMQVQAPEALDLSKEPAHIKELYGVDKKECGHF